MTTRYELARRQVRVGELAANGHTAAEIARTLDISIHRVLADLDAMDFYNDDAGLFPLPEGATPPPPAVGRGEQRQRLIDTRIANRTHPLGYIPLHPDAATGRDDSPGLRCGTCRYRQLQRHHDKTYPKCFKGDGNRVTASEASDVRAWWPACRDHEPAQPHEGT